MAAIPLSVQPIARTRTYRWKPYWFLVVVLILGGIYHTHLERIVGNLLFLIADRAQTEQHYLDALWWVDLGETFGLDHAPLYQKSGIIKTILGRNAEQLQWVKKSGQMENMDSAGYNDSAIYHYLRVDNNLAQQAIATASQLDPNNAIIRYNFGIILQKQAKSQEALTQWKEASFINDAWELPYLQKSIFYLSIAEYALAEENARLAITRNPNLRAGHLVLIQALHQQTHHEADLLVATNDTLKIFPNDATFLLYQALFLRDKGDKAATLQLLNRLHHTVSDEKIRLRVIRELVYLSGGQ